MTDAEAIDAASRRHVLTVGLPPKAVHANARLPWQARAAARRRQRGEARAIASTMQPLKLASFSLSYEFRFADRRRRDLDNLVYAMKASLDGLQDAGLIADDCGVVSLTATQRTLADGEGEPCVIIGLVEQSDLGKTEGVAVADGARRPRRRRKAARATAAAAGSDGRNVTRGPAAASGPTRRNVTRGRGKGSFPGKSPG